MAQYKISWHSFLQDNEETFESFTDAHYRAHSLNRCGYENVKVTVVHPTKASRQYVALAVSADHMPNGRQGYKVLLVGEPGQKKYDVDRIAYNLTGSFGIFLVTLSVAKRSYKRAWKVWEVEHSPEFERAKQASIAASYAEMQELGKNGDVPADWNELS